MISKSVESQAREYVYDVKNCASEFGQSTLEGWEFSLVNDVEKTKIEKNQSLVNIFFFFTQLVSTILNYGLAKFISILF